MTTAQTSCLPLVVGVRPTAPVAFEAGHRLGATARQLAAEDVPLGHPIGASRRWEWHRYYNSDVEVNGERMTSVSGGGHWGGGLWISARDLARVGQLLLDRGAWSEYRLLSEEWVESMTEPYPIYEGYGSLVWRNTGRDRWPSAPESSYAAMGFGRNVVWIDPEHDAVAVLRWLSMADGDDRSLRGIDEALVEVSDRSTEIPR